jgi:hypothetical protein
MNGTPQDNGFGWELPPAPSAAQPPAGKALAFGLPQAEETEIMPVWRIDLPADNAQAARQIHQTLAQARAQQSQLEALPASFDRLAQQAKAGATQAKTVPGTPVQEGSRGVSFGLTEGEPGSTVSSAEAELLATVQQISAAPLTVGEATEKGISFGLTERLGIDLGPVNAQFQAFADRLQRTLAHLAWVETRQEGKLIGQTVVGWSGDCDTLWDQAATDEQMALHRRSLEAALQSRITLLNTFTMAVQGAVKLSVALSTPAGVVLALPTVWKFIHQILADH